MRILTLAIAFAGIVTGMTASLWASDSRDACSGDSCTQLVHASALNTQEIRDLIKKNKGNLDYQELTLDKGKTPDPCAGHPESCLLSKMDTSTLSRDTPIVLLVHGYTATTYEWEDFARYLDHSTQGAVRYSRILLGGHGRSLEVFERSTYLDWGKPILDEYKALVEKGFTHISLAASSTGGALILEQISAGHFATGVKPQNVFVVDPIVEGMGWVASIVIRAGTMMNKSYGPQQASSPEEFAHWYSFRPFATLKSLNALTTKISGDLNQKKLRFPSGTNLYVFASQNDPTVNPKGYLLIQEGVVMNGGKATYEPIDSNLHVFTRLSGRPRATAGEEESLPKLTHKEVLDFVKTAPIPFTKHDLEIQKQTFETMVRAIQGH